MSVETINPAGVYAPSHYSQVSVCRGSRTVYLSGQVSVDPSGALIGKDDFAAQAEQVYRNVGAALKGVGATFQDVAKLTVFVPGWTPDKMELLIAGAMRAAEDIGFDPLRPITLIGVAALSSPDHLIEVEAIAVLD